MTGPTPCQPARRRHFMDPGILPDGLKILGETPKSTVAERSELLGNAFLNIFNKRPSRLVLVLGLGLIVAIGVVDVLTGPELSFSIFYLLPIFLTTFAAGRPAGDSVSTIRAVLWAVAGPACVRDVRL